MDRLRVKRQEVFEFTKKPVVTRRGDSVTITFASKAFCDATVAIEDVNGPSRTSREPKIVRHLASGVLGDNAPAPFQKNSLRQTIVWDGKDEIGRYVDDRGRLTVRVSLGLEARMERTLFWSGHRRAAGQHYQLMRATPEGVYVLTRGLNTQLRLYDHDGNYERTIYPFPRNKIDEVKGLEWREFPPDNERLPSKLYGHDQNSLLPDRPAGSRHGIWAGRMQRYGFDLLTRDMAVRGERIVLAGSRLLYLATDGSTGGRDLSGPVVERPPRNSFALPNSIALSPDGRKAYLTGYYLARQGQGFSSLSRAWHHDVNVVDLASGDISRFAGSPDGVSLPKGGDNAHFRYPMGVACDAKGRVYVADNLNNRIQAYLPDGTFLKTIPVKRPGIVCVNPKNGDIWVRSSNLGYCGREDARIGKANSWGKAKSPQVLTHFGPVENPEIRASYPMPVRTGWERGTWFYDQYVEMDFHTDPPTIWASSNPQDKQGTRIRLFRPAKGKLVLKRDLEAEAGKALVRPAPWRFARARVAVHPATGKLFLGLQGVSHHEVVIVDPRTGTVKAAPLPTDAEDFAFDWEGRIYLRTYNAVTRFDPRTWREVPFDYGSQRVVHHGGNGYARAKNYRAVSALDLPSGGCDGLHLGGFGVAPDGTIAVACINPASPVEKKRIKDKKIRADSAGKRYTAPVYPGRAHGQEIHILDRHGKLVEDDLVPGIARCNDVELDRNGNVYVLAASAPYLHGKPYFNGRGCTLMKVVPGQMKGLAAAKAILPLPDTMRPKRPPDMTRPGIWVEGAEWLFGPVGADGHYGSGGKCHCRVMGRFALDCYGRSFAPEVDRYRVVVLDPNGNVILRIGRCGNVDDGMPLVDPETTPAGSQGGQPPNPRSIGGDETAVMHAQSLGVDSDRRLFVADSGNQCVRSVKLGYHTEMAVPLRALPDSRK
jgi:DNA-binding beta-propeller fold protein YncE